jgi:hypothetical protein
MESHDEKRNMEMPYNNFTIIIMKSIGLGSTVRKNFVYNVII